MAILASKLSTQLNTRSTALSLNPPWLKNNEILIITLRVEEEGRESEGGIERGRKGKEREQESNKKILVGIGSGV